MGHLKRKDLDEKYAGGIIGDTIKILGAKSSKKKAYNENITAFLFTEEQVKEVLSYFKGDKGIKVSVKDDIFYLTRV